MAGAGYKAFADGDVLTAAQVQTYLQDQAVMRFADSSARTSGLGTAVAEGMVSYLQDTDAVEVYDGSAWVGVGSDPNPGIGTSVVQAVKTDVFTTTSNTFVDLTGISVSITPSSATSKILVLLDIAATGINATVGANLKLRRDSTDIYVGDAAGSRTRLWAFDESVGSNIGRQVGVYLDSPATTSSVTYSVQIRSNVSAQTVFVNRAASEADSATYGRTASSITVIEVAV